MPLGRVGWLLSPSPGCALPSAIHRATGAASHLLRAFHGLSFLCKLCSEYHLHPWMLRLSMLWAPCSFCMNGDSISLRLPDPFLGVGHPFLALGTLLSLKQTCHHGVGGWGGMRGSGRCGWISDGASRMTAVFQPVSPPLDPISFLCRPSCLQLYLLPPGR